MKPNIFNIATKELHQDAFITWLLQWADPQSKQYDNLLHSCGQDFVKQLISTQHQNSNLSITKIEAGRQWEYIDVWAEVHTSEKNYLIIIENKIFSVEHSNQLLTYKKTGEEYCLKENFELVCIYIKTGNESEKVLNSIRLKGFSTFNRTNFIQLLDSYNSIENDIFQDFTHRLLNIDATYKAFESTIINEWNSECWIGFYAFLEQEMGLVDWFLVNPRGGGPFWAAILNWDEWKGFPVFLQIDQGPLCFKITTDEDEIDVDYKPNPSEVRNEWHSTIIAKATTLGKTEIQRPKKFGHGSTMSAAIVDRSSWLGEGSSLINKSEVISRLRGYMEFQKSILT